MVPRFLQIHTLTAYPATLLNRDDVGFAKRIPFGGTERTRISSQCLKRHWRTADDDQALDRLPDDGARLSIRSRRTFEEYLYKPLLAAGVDVEVAAALTRTVLETLLPEGKKRRGLREDGEEGEAQPEGKRRRAAKAEKPEPGGLGESFHTEQVTVLGHPEMEYLLSLARQAAAEAAGAKAAVQAFEATAKDLKKNLQTLVRGAGIDAAVFGRMTTGDILARCDAAVHVAHAFTVHEGQPETDYFSAIDDLQPKEETGSGHINTAELTTGLYYGYVVVDLPLLVSNLEGCDRRRWLEVDRALAAEVVRRLIHLIATVSPGAKRGATAPYAHAALVLAEAGNRQPRTLANAFFAAVPAQPDTDLLATACARLARHLAHYDQMYGPEAERRVAAMEVQDGLVERTGGRLDLPSLASWAAQTIERAG
jgi:CRISPR system Cascade subunit CasC